MRQRDLDSIKKAAVEKHDGNVEVAAAEHIYGEHVIARAGGQVPTGVDHDQIAEIVKAIGPVKKPAAKKPAGKKRPAKKKTVARRS
jgi:hypothetical protein